MKNLYIVKNITSAETNSAGVFRQDAVIGSDTYSLIKTDKTSVPVGENVEFLSADEFNANIHSYTFGGDNCEAFREEELRFSEEIATEFASAQSGLNSADGNVLFDVFKPAFALKESPFIEIAPPCNIKFFAKPCLLISSNSIPSKPVSLFKISIPPSSFG